MKLFITFIAIVEVVSAVKQDVYKLPPESLSRLKTIALPCAQDFNVDPKTLDVLGSDKLPRDDATNKYLHCFSVKSGFVDKDGHIVIDKLASIIKDHPRVEEFKEELKKCEGVTKDNPVATTVAAHECYCKNSPIIFELVE